MDEFKTTAGSYAVALRHRAQGKAVQGRGAMAGAEQPQAWAVRVLPGWGLDPEGRSHVGEGFERGQTPRAATGSQEVQGDAARQR